jgi:hypothetical protein
LPKQNQSSTESERIYLHADEKPARLSEGVESGETYGFRYDEAKDSTEIRIARAIAALHRLLWKSSTELRRLP